MKVLSFLAVMAVGAVLLTGQAIARTAQPNILVVLTDDQATETFDYMPFLQRAKRKARVFRHYVHTMSQCCPSRTSMFTGMYPHNSKVESNVGPDGGYARFKSENLAPKTWNYLLRNTGYLTGIAGKFLNGYDYPETEIPAGWNDWFVIHGTGVGFNYYVSNNGTTTFFGKGDSNYMTNVLADRVDALIRGAHQARKPFAALFSTGCPHAPSTPANKYRGSAASLRVPIFDKPSFDEADMSDKPAITARPNLSTAQKDYIEMMWRRRIECTRSIDDALGRFWNTLHSLRELDNTYILLTTDNGWMQGEHRIPKAKNVPYVESFESRLFLWGPGVVPDKDNRIVANIDLMPTILEMGGLNPSDYDWIDGRSLLSIGKGQQQQWRDTILLRGSPEPDENDGGKQIFRALFGTRANDRPLLYTQYLGAAGQFEFYDLRADPYQLASAYNRLSQRFKNGYQQRLDTLATCAGATCRQIENMPAP